MTSTRTAQFLIRMAAAIGLSLAGGLAGPAADLFEDRTPLVNGARQPMFAAREAPPVQSASLFTGRKDDGLFGPASRRSLTGSADQRLGRGAPARPDRAGRGRARRL